MKRDNRRFQAKAWGGSGVYVCRICGKKTRETGEGESDVQLCRSCYTMSGQENAHSDNNHAGKFEDCPICKESLLQAWNPEYFKF